MGLFQCDRVTQTSPFITLSVYRRVGNSSKSQACSSPSSPAPDRIIQGMETNWLAWPSGSLLPSGREPCPVPRKLYDNPEKAHISKERCRFQISHYWHNGTKQLEWPQASHAWGKEKATTPVPAVGRDLPSRRRLPGTLAAGKKACCVGPTFSRTASLFTICLTLRQVSPDGHRERGHWVLCSSSHCGHIVTFLCLPLLFILE